MPCGIPVAFPVRFVRHRAIVPARLLCRTTRNAGDGDAATASAADATAANLSTASIFPFRKADTGGAQV